MQSVVSVYTVVHYAILSERLLFKRMLPTSVFYGECGIL